MNPEVVLWTRVLLQAIWDMAGVRVNTSSRYVPQIQRSARAWICSRVESPGSFVWTCNCLSLDPDTVRRHIFSKSTAQLSALSEVELQAAARRLEAQDNSDSNIEESAVNEALPVAEEAFAARESAAG
jgi:hypothetical protein